MGRSLPSIAAVTLECGTGTVSWATSAASVQARLPSDSLGDAAEVGLSGFENGGDGLVFMLGSSFPCSRRGGLEMEAVVQMFGGAATLIAVLGGTLSTIFFAWAGIRWMMAAGDTKKIFQARMALIGAAVGLIIVGAAFIVPEVISERIIEPAGGTVIRGTALSCDRVLKNQLVFQRSASTVDLMNAIIGQIQAQRGECASDIWDPEIVGNAGWECSSAGKIGDTDVPRGLEKTQFWSIESVELSRRDADNNVLVYFDPAKLPADSSQCWLYVDRLKTWDQEY